MKISSALRLCLPCFFAAGMALSNANAQTPDSWPSKQVRIVVPYVAGAMGELGADLMIKNARPDTLDVVIDKLREAGLKIEVGADWIHVTMNQRPKAVSFKTSEYPAFPTDMQAQFMAMNVVAKGTSTVIETIFENRFMHVQELQRLGAHITVDGKTAVIQGGVALSGAHVMATDLRASASLVIAGLVADGETTVERVYHLDRGYDRMEVKLRALGARIERVRA